MKIRDVMSRRVHVVSPTTPFRDIWKVIFKRHVNSIPVVDAKKQLVGIITREDLLKSLYPDYKDVIDDFSSASDFEGMEEKVRDLLTLSAKNFMSRRVIYTREDTPVMRALSRMIVRRVNQLPVLNARNNVVGMVTKGDVFYALFRKHLRSS